MNIIEILACALVLYVVVRLLFFTWYMIRCFVLTSFGFTVNLKKFGNWAVVTGATDGIGKAYVEEFASRGLDVVLISRNKEKLEHVAKVIRERYNVNTKIIVFDFSATDGYDMIKEEIEDLDVGILVNNVGTSGVYEEFFDRIDIKQIQDVATTNMFGELNMTHIVLPGMVARKRGVVVHVSSGFGYFPGALVNIYPSTKAFVNSFVNGLQMECEAVRDLHHQLVTPMFVSTNMTGMKEQDSLSAPSATKYVRSAVNTIGLSNNTFGYWFHELQALLLFFPPNIIERLIMQKNRHIRLTKRFIKRD